MERNYIRYTVRTDLCEGDRIRIRVDDNYWDTGDCAFMPVGGGELYACSDETAAWVAQAFRGLEEQLLNLEAPARYHIECEDVWGKNPLLVRID